MMGLIQIFPIGILRSGICNLILFEGLANQSHVYMALASAELMNRTFSPIVCHVLYLPLEVFLPNLFINVSLIQVMVQVGSSTFISVQFCYIYSVPTDGET